MANATGYGNYQVRQTKCKSMANNNLYKLPYYAYTFSGSESALMSILNQFQVSVAVGVHANNNFMAYGGGIFQVLFNHG